nr:MAG TPA: hypothetical protein [Microviridae sp.]
MMNKIKKLIYNKLFAITNSERKIIINVINIARYKIDKGQYQSADDILKQLNQKIKYKL